MTTQLLNPCRAEKRRSHDRASSPLTSHRPFHIHTRSYHLALVARVVE